MNHRIIYSPCHRYDHRCYHTHHVIIFGIIIVNCSRISSIAQRLFRVLADEVTVEMTADDVNTRSRYNNDRVPKSDEYNLYWASRTQWLYDTIRTRFTTVKNDIQGVTRAHNAGISVSDMKAAKVAANLKVQSQTQVNEIEG